MQQSNKTGTPNKGSLQTYIQSFTREAIDAIVRTMRESHNENLRFGAAKVIIDKSIPDVKYVEVTGENGEPIKLIINAGSGFIPSTVQFNATSAGSCSQGQSTIQSDNLASESKQNDNSDNRNDKAGTS